MRTLEEVIDKLIECHTRWCRWSETSDIVDRSAVEDAIEYLQEYRDECNNIINVHDDYINLRNEMAEELNKRNPPLTWDELKTMMGKPVWVHEYDPIDDTKGWHRCRWYLVNCVNDTYFYVYDMDGVENYFYLSDCGKTWTAYRKEKK